MSLPEELAEPAEQLERALSASVDVPQTLFEASAVSRSLLASAATQQHKYFLLVSVFNHPYSLTAARPAGYRGRAAERAGADHDLLLSGVAGQETAAAQAGRARAAVPDAQVPGRAIRAVQRAGR